MASVLTEGGAPAKYDAAQLKLLSLLVEKPELKDAAAAKLASIASELEQTVSMNGHPKAPSPIDKLKSGFAGFKANYYDKQPHLFEPLKTGQSPKVFVIACCDSRASPEVIMGANPGEVFTLRNIANLVPPMETTDGLHSTSAALEYAVLHLKVEHIVVKGHRACGGIQALMTAKAEEKHADDGFKSFIGDWMNIAAPAKAKTLQECEGKDLQTQLRYCEKESVNNSLRNLLTFPYIKQAVDEGRLQLHGFYYDFVDGALSTWTL